MKPAVLVFLGGLLAALAVALGAIGAHALKPLLSPQQLETFHTAVHYQMIHAVGLVLTGLLSLHKRSRLTDLAGWAMLLGILLFSGFLYAWLATGVTALVHVVPVGGTALIVAWLLLAVGGLRMNGPSVAKMIALAIDPQLKAAAPNTAVGVLTATVAVTQHDAGLWQQIDAKIAQIAGQAATMDEVRRLPPIRATWQAYKALGQDPTRYRGSAEALYRRIVQGKGLYRVNTVVDINNLVSLETMCACGTTDLERVKPPVVLRIGRPDEVYAGIGRGEIKLARIPVFADADGPFASTTSDSERAMVTLRTTRLLMLIISFNGPHGVAESLDRSASLLQLHAQAGDVQTALVE